MKMALTIINQAAKKEILLRCLCKSTAINILGNLGIFVSL